jgi:Xaa-Pro dipeptidase
MLNIDKARKALREEGLSAWFLYNVFHRDEIADTVLEVSPERTNTRPWACIISLDRPPVKIVHRIEESILSHVPGDTVSYYTRKDLLQALGTALPRAGSVAADYSPGIPVGSFFDHGAALLLQSLGATLAPAEGLVSRFLGAIDEAGRRSHEAAGRVLYAAVKDAWARLASAFRAGKAVTEGDARGWIAQSIAQAGLESDAPPVVGAGPHTSDPHYGFAGAGSRFAAGDVVQFDVWARGKEQGNIYADISWVGVCAAAASAEQLRTFAALRQARDAGIALLEARVAEGKPVRGAEVDAAVRAVLIEHGFEAGLRHRTGHSIGGRVHGFGVNLDSVEFPDERLLTDGACFSVEPGLYLGEFGMRTEVDCCIHDGRLDVTGGERQMGLLTLG